jgi:hypothetical protein
VPSPAGALSAPGATFEPKPPASEPHTLATWGQTGSGTKPRGRAGLWIGAAALLGALGASGALLLHKTESSPPSPPIAPTTLAGSATTAEATPPQPTTDAGATQASPKPASPRPPPTGGAVAPPVARPPPRPAAPAAAPRPAAKPSCSPPYVIDPATGDRRYKPECLN